MSVDDKVARDPRITRLAARLGWHRHRVVGCLILDVWALCYDLETPHLTRENIDASTGQAGFTDHMIAVDLATETRAGIRVAGASERIEYLHRARDAGKRGGINSGITRRSAKPLKASRSNPQGSSKPPDPVPDPVPLPAPDPVPDVASPDSAPFFDFDACQTSSDTAGPEPGWWGNPAPAAPAPKPKGRRKAAVALPPDWSPGPYSVPEGVDVQRELERFRNHARANDRRQADWNAAWRNWLLKAEEYASRQAKPKRDAMDVFLDIAEGRA
jgi:hypothetical protein